jgi:hypothetical protein
VDPQIAAVLWNAVAADKLPIEAFVSYLQTGELPEDLKEQMDTLRFIATEAQQNAAAEPPKPAVEIRDAAGNVTHRIAAADRAAAA